MPRILGEERHRLAIQDPVSGSAITLYFRRPTSEERVAYQLSVFHLDGGDRRLRLSETRLRFGLEILVGFDPGNFILQENGRNENLDPDRHPDWKERLAKTPRTWCPISANKCSRACGSWDGEGPNGADRGQSPGWSGWPGTQEVLTELRQIGEGRLCRPEQRQLCRAEHGAFADWACQACAEYLRPEAVSPWTWHLMFLHRLKKAGYPIPGQ
jgi:hypothetical protein